MSLEIVTMASNQCTKNATTNPWGKPAPIQPCSLEDVMSEQLATELQNKEDKHVDQELQLQEASKLSEATAPSRESSTDTGGSAPAPKLTDAEAAFKLVADDAELAAKLAADDVGYDPNDEMIALMLQKQYDREYDSSLSKKEQKYNGNSKVSISFDNYKRKHMQSEYQNGEDDEEDDDFYEEERPDHPNRTQWDSGAPTIGARGYSGRGKNIVTKHDSVICGRRNAQRLMQFPPDFDSGDGEGMDMQLPNGVYNKLKRHSQTESKKSHKVHEKKDHSTAIKAVDEKTRMLIFKMVNCEYLSSVDGVVSEGKEAVVLKAIGGKRDDDVELPKDVILKVYKTSMNEFKARLRYIHGDYRLSKDTLRKFNPRKLMRMWAEKEYLNLKKMRRQCVPCPSVLTLRKHILVMSCIGGEKPAPKLRDVLFSAEDCQDVYEQTVDIMKIIYHKCNMVHADFSPYNLLWHDGKVWVIDVGQAVDRENSNSASFLLRDCKNVCDFFRQRGVHNVPTAENLYNEITNHTLQGEGKVFVSEVQRYEKEQYAFDYFFEQSEDARLQKLDIDSSSESDEEECEEEYEDGEEENKESCSAEVEKTDGDEGDGRSAETSSKTDTLVVVD